MQQQAQSIQNPPGQTRYPLHRQIENDWTNKLNEYIQGNLRVAVVLKNGTQTSPDTDDSLVLDLDITALPVGHSSSFELARVSKVGDSRRRMWDPSMHYNAKSIGPTRHMLSTFFDSHRDALGDDAFRNDFRAAITAYSRREAHRGQFCHILQRQNNSQEWRSVDDNAAEGAQLGLQLNLPLDSSRAELNDDRRKPGLTKAQANPAVLQGILRQGTFQPGPTSDGTGQIDHPFADLGKFLEKVRSDGEGSHLRFRLSSPTVTLSGGIPHLEFQLKRIDDTAEDSDAGRSNSSGFIELSLNNLDNAAVTNWLMTHGDVLSSKALVPIFVQTLSDLADKGLHCYSVVPDTAPAQLEIITWQENVGAIRLRRSKQAVTGDNGTLGSAILRAIQVNTRKPSDQYFFNDVALEKCEVEGDELSLKLRLSWKKLEKPQDMTSAFTEGDVEVLPVDQRPWRNCDQLSQWEALHPEICSGESLITLRTLTQNVLRRVTHGSSIPISIKSDTFTIRCSGVKLGAAMRIVPEESDDSDPERRIHSYHDPGLGEEDLDGWGVKLAITGRSESRKTTPE